MILRDVTMLQALLQLVICPGIYMYIVVPVCYDEETACLKTNGCSLKRDLLMVTPILFCISIV